MKEKPSEAAPSLAGFGDERKPMNSYQNSFLEFLRDVIGNGLYLVVSLALGAVSFYTTDQGFLEIFGRWPSLLAALGVQAAMLVAWIFFGHNRAPHRRIPWLVVGLFTSCLSICFSYVGVRSFYAKDVLKRERPIHDRADFQSQRGHLQEAAAMKRGTVLAQIDDLIADREGRRGLAQLNQNARNVKAAEYRQVIATLNRERRDIPADLTPEQRSVESDRLQKQIRNYEALLAVAEGTRDTLALDMLKQQTALEPLRKLRLEITNYTPAFRDIKDDEGTGHPDWNGLRLEYDRFLSLMDETPGDADFKAELAKGMPEPPGPEVISADGKVFEGEGHPIDETFRHLVHLELADVFLFALAASFDLIPLLYTWSLRPKVRTIPEAISALGTWMRRTRLALETLEGIFPFLWNFCAKILFSHPTRIGHDSVIAFEEFITREQLRMDALLQNLVLPDALRELIGLEMGYMHIRAVTIASERAGQFERLALNAYERCRAAVQNASGIDERTRAELIRFLNQQLQRFTATAAECGTEGEILEDIASDNDKEVPQTEKDNRNPQPNPGESQQHRETSTTLDEAIQT
jgi:hypothetical protein